jgi:23S rRNA pseudouridine2604 synthase
MPDRDQDPTATRLAKLMAQRGLCSRREAERLILAGMVEVDGRVVNTTAEPVPAHAKIVIVGQGRRWLDTKITVLMHKPAGIVSTMPEGEQVPAWQLLTKDRLHDPAGRAEHQTVERVLAKPWLLSVAGRLDKDSRGLLVMTTDGRLVKGITGGTTISKQYRVTVDQPVTKRLLERLNGPRQLDGKPLLPMRVEGAVGGTQLTFTLREGRKHQIRRVCQEEGLKVLDLLRDRIGEWGLGDLPEGQWCIVPSVLKPERPEPETESDDVEPAAAPAKRGGKPARSGRTAGAKPAPAKPAAAKPKADTPAKPAKARVGFIKRKA